MHDLSSDVYSSVYGSIYKDEHVMVYAKDKKWDRRINFTNQFLAVDDVTFTEYPKIKSVNLDHYQGYIGLAPTSADPYHMDSNFLW